MIDSYIPQSENLFLTFFWIPASAGMTSNPKECHSRENGNPDFKNFKYLCLGFIYTKLRIRSQT
jgi:hypothetical protein